MPRYRTMLRLPCHVRGDARPHLAEEIDIAIRRRRSMAMPGIVFTSRAEADDFDTMGVHFARGDFAPRSSSLLILKYPFFDGTARTLARFTISHARGACE